MRNQQHVLYLVPIPSYRPLPGTQMGKVLELEEEKEKKAAVKNYHPKQHFPERQTPESQPVEKANDCFVNSRTRRKTLLCCCCCCCCCVQRVLQMCCIACPFANPTQRERLIDGSEPHRGKRRKRSICQNLGRVAEKHRRDESAHTHIYKHSKITRLLSGN